MRRPAPPQAGAITEPFETMLRTAIELRKSLLLDEKQTQRWSAMQADLREVLERRRALRQKPADPNQVPNPALLFVQDMASAERAFGAALDQLSKSMQAALDTLDDRQKNAFVESMSAALTSTSP